MPQILFLVDEAEVGAGKVEDVNLDETKVVHWMVPEQQCTEKIPKTTAPLSVQQADKETGAGRVGAVEDADVGKTIVVVEEIGLEETVSK
jgi:hypothetical protein